MSAEMKAFLRSVIESPEYQAALRARMIAGKAAHMEQLAAHDTCGKPQEQVQVQTTPSMAKLLIMGITAADERQMRERGGQGRGGWGLPLPPEA